MGMEERAFGPLSRTSKVLTADELLKNMDKQAPMTAEVTSQYSPAEQKAFYDFAKKFLDSKIAGKLNPGTQSEADSIVKDITDMFGPGMASWTRTKTIDRHNEDVYILNIKFPEIKKKFYPDMPMSEVGEHQMEVPKEENYGKTA